VNYCTYRPSAQKPSFISKPFYINITFLYKVKKKKWESGQRAHTHPSNTSNLTQNGRFYHFLGRFLPVFDKIVRIFSAQFSWPVF